MARIAIISAAWNAFFNRHVRRPSVACGGIPSAVLVLLLVGIDSIDAAPFIKFSLEGRKEQSNDPFTNNLVVEPGDVIEYRLRVDLPPVGTSNRQFNTTNTITQTVPGRDGFNSLSLLTVSQSPIDGIQTHFASPAMLVNGWDLGTGSRGGIPTHRAGSAWNDLVDVRAVHRPGVLSGIDPETVFTGTFSVNEVTGPFAQLDVGWSRAFGMRINNGTVTLFPNPAIEDNRDPWVGLAPLTLITPFDVGAKEAIADYRPGGPNPTSLLRGQIVSGRGGVGVGKGLWTGKGLTSAVAAAQNAIRPEMYSVGYVDNANLPFGAFTKHGGKALDETSVLIRYTRTGDANLDGVVNDDDVTVVGTFYAPGVSKPEWAKGDFDFNGFVDDDDVTLLGVFYDPTAEPIPSPMQSSATNVSAMPEPATLAMFLTFAAFAAVVRALRCGRNVRRNVMLALGCAAWMLFSTASGRADILRWDNGQVIPGTEGITAGPGVNLDFHELGFADLRGLSLVGAKIRAASLADAKLDGSDLTNLELSSTDISRTSFRATHGLSKFEFYATSSYQQRSLIGVSMAQIDVSGWDFNGQNMTFAGFEDSNPSGANLTGTRLSFGNLVGANLTGAVIVNAKLNATGITLAQIYSTDDYVKRRVSADLGASNLAGANFAAYDLRSAGFSESVLTGADLTSAIVSSALFNDTTARGFVKEQLYSTASYVNKLMTGIGLAKNDLSGWDFGLQRMDIADLRQSNLTGANFTSANLQRAQLGGANLTDAVIRSSNLSNTDLTKEQLYTTATYKQKALAGINLAATNLSGANLRGQILASANLQDTNLLGADLTDARLDNATIIGAVLANTNLTPDQLYLTTSYKLKMLDRVNFSGDDLTEWDFTGQRLTGANFTGALIAGALFSGSNLTKEQLYSTASYQQKNLVEIGLGPFNLIGWNLSEQNLAYAKIQSSVLTDANLVGAQLQYANLSGSTLTRTNLSNSDLGHANLLNAILTNANLTGANISDADLTNTSLTREQLYSTTSYVQKNLQGVGLGGNNLTGADLRGQDLTRADLTRTTLTGANLTGAIVESADLRSTAARGFTKEQLYSTASYLEKNLHGLDLSDNNLGGWDFSTQNLTGARFEIANLTNVNLAGAVVKRTSFSGATSFTKEQLYSTASYQQRDLQGIRLTNLVLSGWDFRGQDLRGGQFSGTTLIGTDFSLADLRGVTGSLSRDSPILRNTIDPDSIVVDLALLPGETLVAHAGAELPVGIFGEFSIAPTAKLDITDNAAIVYEAPAAAVRAQLITGRGRTGLGGAWTGNGIASSTAAAANQASPDARSIGYALNGTLPLGSHAEFRGFPVDENSVLVAYTRTGDANLDGVVNDDDVTVVGTFYAPGVAKPEWAKGDFDYNGFVDDDDVTLLGVFYNPNAEPIPAPLLGGVSNLSAVPEPATVAQMLCAIAFAALVVLHAIVSRRRKMAVGNASRGMLAQA